MPEVTLILPREFKRRLEEEAEKEGKIFEEPLIETLGKVYGISPAIKVQFHSELCEKCLKETTNFLEKGKYKEGSGKIWGAAIQMIKAVASKRGVDIKLPADLYTFVAGLQKELKYPELARLFGLAGILHQNSNEGWLPPEIVTDYIEAVIQFIEKLKELV